MQLIGHHRLPTDQQACIVFLDGLNLSPFLILITAPIRSSKKSTTLRRCWPDVQSLNLLFKAIMTRMTNLAVKPGAIPTNGRPGPKPYAVCLVLYWSVEKQMILIMKKETIRLKHSQKASSRKSIWSYFLRIFGFSRHARKARARVKTNVKKQRAKYDKWSQQFVTVHIRHGLAVKSKRKSCIQGKGI